MQHSKHVLESVIHKIFLRGLLLNIYNNIIFPLLNHAKFFKSIPVNHCQQVVQ